ncbi:MAG TPA: site-specific integrase, partial [Thermomicrobiales bacterium]|nr:site-specific integrase [Thermomicrobiales bacterium]
MNLTKAFERYLRFHRAEGSSPKTLEWHTYSLRQFCDYLTTHNHSGDVEDLCADDLRAYIDELRERGL